MYKLKEEVITLIVAILDSLTKLATSINKASKRLDLELEKRPFLFISKILAIALIISAIDIALFNKKEKRLEEVVYVYGELDIYQKKSGFWGTLHINNEKIKFKIPIGGRYNATTGVTCNILNKFEVVAVNARFYRYTDYEIIGQKNVDKSQCNATYLSADSIKI